MGYLRNIRTLYWMTFFHALIPAYVIERLFWQQRGINVQMVVYCEIIYAVTVTLLEVPSGILADRFGRKRMLMVCAALSLAEFVLLLFAQGFWQFALAVFLAGIGKAFSSGSENALLYDSLAAAGKREAFETYLGRIRAIDFSASLIAALCGGVLANYYELAFNYVVSIVSMGIALAAAFFLREPPGAGGRDPAAEEAPRFFQHALRVFRSNPLVLRYCFTGAVLGACFIYLDEFWQILAEAVEVPVLFFGVLGAVLLGSRIPGNLLAYKLKGKVSYRKLLAGMLFINAAGYLLVFCLRNMLCLIPVLLISLSAGIADPLIFGYLHHHTESRVRATTESMYSLMTRVISIGIGLLFGVVATKVSIFAGFLLLAGVSFLYLILYLELFRRSAVKRIRRSEGE